MTLSLICPTPPTTLRAAVAFGRFAHAAGVRRMWTGQSLHIESHLALAAVAARVPGLALGTSVALTPLRHPYQAAVEARSLSALTGAPYVAGYGPGARDLQSALMPTPYPKPLRAVGEYVSVMRRLLDGGTVDHQGEHHTTRLRLAPMAAPPVEIGLGVLRPGMARLAGRVADVALTWLAPPGYLEGTLIPAMTTAAQAHRRRPPRVAAVVHAAVRRPGRDPVTAAHAALGAHVAAPHYTDMLHRAGVPTDPRDPLEGARLLVEHGVFLTGTATQISQHIAHYEELGVDEVVLSTAGVLLAHGAEAALHDARDILSAHAEQAAETPV